MGHRSLLLVVLLAVTACAAPERTSETGTEMTVSAYLVGAPAQAVRITVEAVPEERPIERIILAGPGGLRLEAGALRPASGQAWEGRTVTSRIALPNPAAYLAAPEDWIIIVVTQDLRGRIIAYQFPAPRP